MNEGTPYRVAPSYGLEKCPHCGGLTIAVPHETLRWVCGVCGGPVVPGVDATMLRIEASRALEEAGALHSSKAFGRMVLFLVLLVLLALLLRDSLVRVLLGMTAAALASGLNALASRTAREKRLGKVKALVEGAWVDAAATLARKRGGRLSAKDLAKTTRISVEDAEGILTRLSAERGEVDIDEELAMHYRVDAGEEVLSEDLATSQSSNAKQARTE